MDKKLQLSKKSTRLASIRTFLSYIRTALVCLSVAFGFMKIDKNQPIDAFTIILFILSAISIIFGIITIISTNNLINKISNDD